MKKVLAIIILSLSFSFIFASSALATSPDIPASSIVSKLEYQKDTYNGPIISVTITNSDNETTDAKCAIYSRKDQEDWKILSTIDCNTNSVTDPSQTYLRVQGAGKYEFYSIIVDSLGNKEQKTPLADGTITITTDMLPAIITTSNTEASPANTSQSNSKTPNENNASTKLIVQDVTTNKEDTQTETVSSRPMPTLGVLISILIIAFIIIAVVVIVKERIDSNVHRIKTRKPRQRIRI